MSPLSVDKQRFGNEEVTLYYRQVAIVYSLINKKDSSVFPPEHTCAHVSEEHHRNRVYYLKKR